MQYRIWAEMINGSLHSDLDNPPSTSMFTGVGNQSVNKKSLPVTQAITETANALTSLCYQNSPRQLMAVYMYWY